MQYNYANNIKKNKKRKARIIFAFFLIIIILLYFYLHFIVNPVIVEASEAKIKSLTQSTVSSSVLSVIGDKDIFNELIHYQYDSNNKISMININSFKANQLARQISSISQASLNNINNQGVDIHLGAFLGITVLATSGPTVTFNIAPIGTISVQFKNEYASVGINQSIHKIYINVLSAVHVVLPTSNPKIETNTEVLLAECVVIGEIPSTYLQSSYLDEMLNLVPVS